MHISRFLPPLSALSATSATFAFEFEKANPSKILSPSACPPARALALSAHSLFVPFRSVPLQIPAKALDTDGGLEAFSLERHEWAREIEIEQKYEHHMHASLPLPLNVCTCMLMRGPPMLKLFFE